MTQIIEARGTDAVKLFSRAAEQTDEKVEKAVAAILADVRENGDEAVARYTERFDGARPDSLSVSAEEIAEAVASEPTEFMDTLKRARDNIEDFHRRQLREGFEYTRAEGIVLGQKITPLARVGLYIPGGTAAYPSSLLMNAVPAKLAGVPDVVMATPPGRDGRARPEILAAAHVAGIDTIYKMGGAQAIGALAYGTESVNGVDKIVGPGNIFVAVAKKQVFGAVDIDMIAGPSEILVIADAKSDPGCVAADLISQAEHGERSVPVLVCDDSAFARRVDAEIERQLAILPRREIATAAFRDYGRIIVTGDIHEAVAISNAIAPEHLELCVDEPFEYLPEVVNAGSIFLGRSAPEALGDYFAGTNHTLPTGGTARFSSPLGVDDFVKRSSYIYYSSGALASVADDIVRFARREGLEGHARSVLSRRGEIK